MIHVASEALQTIFHSAPVALIVHDSAGEIVYANAESCRFLELRPDELLGTHIRSVMKIGGAPVQAKHQHGTPAGMFAAFHGKITPGGSQSISVEIDVRNIQIENEDYFIIVFRKIDGTTQHEEGQSYSDRLAGRSGLWDYDIANDILFCDRQWYRIMGRSHRTPITSIEQFRSFIHEDDVERATEVKLTASMLMINQQDYRNEFRIILPSGKIRWIGSTACIIKDRIGGASRALGYVIELTGNRNSRSALSDDGTRRKVK